MIRFKVGDVLFEFVGSLSCTTTEKYLYEKKNPYNPTLTYRFGKYYQDALTLSIVADSADYEDLYYAVAEALKNDSYLISWETESGYQVRKIKKLLPYPSEVRFGISDVNITLETEPYNEITKNMTNLTINRIWNVSTISNTNIAFAMGTENKGGSYAPPIPDLVEVTLGNNLLTGDFRDTVLLVEDGFCLLYE